MNSDGSWCHQEVCHLMWRSSWSGKSRDSRQSGMSWKCSSTNSRMVHRLTSSPRAQTRNMSWLRDGSPARKMKSRPSRTSKSTVLQLVVVESESREPRSAGESKPQPLNHSPFIAFFFLIYYQFLNVKKSTKSFFPFVKTIF